MSIITAFENLNLLRHKEKEGHKCRGKNNPLEILGGL
jgi:hypothetical protein